MKKMTGWMTGFLAIACAGVLAGCSTSASLETAALDVPAAIAAVDSSDPSLDSSLNSEAATGEIRIALTSSANFAAVKAKAKYKNRNGERELQVEAENLRVGFVLSVCVSGARVGGATANSLGAARLNLNTNLRQSVPNVVSGTRIELRAGSSCAGALVASGRF
jgi:ABC-type phosphate transport system substrate-binding protein